MHVLCRRAAGSAQVSGKGYKDTYNKIKAKDPAPDWFIVYKYTQTKSGQQHFVAWGGSPLKLKLTKKVQEFYDRLEETLDYGRWWCGHFHTDWSIDKMRFMYYDILELKKANIREKDRNRETSTREASER